MLLLGRAGRARHRLDGAGASSRPSPAAGSSRRRGLVTGVLTAGGATGQLVFLPLLAWLVDATTAGVAAALVVAGGRAGRRTRWWCGCCATTRRDLGLPPYGGDRGRRRRPGAAPAAPPGAPSRALRRRGPDPAVLAARRRLRDLRRDAPTGWSAPHFIPAAHDHGMPADDGGRAARRWSASSTSSARSPPAGSPTGSTRGCCCWRLLRAARAVAARAAAACSRRRPQPSMLVVHRLLRPGLGGHRAADGGAVPASTSAPPAPIVFGWVFASHQFGRGGRGVRRRASSATTGSYDLAWYVAGGAVHGRGRRCRSRSGATRRRLRRRAAHELHGGGRGPGPRLTPSVSRRRRPRGCSTGR